MKKCDYYDLKPVSRHIYSQYTGELLNTQHGFVGICLGTKDREECSCGGDREKCNFYPGHYKKSVTNADKIRTMSDFELRQFICGCNRCKTCRWYAVYCCKLADWLKQPVEEDKND